MLNLFRLQYLLAPAGAAEAMRQPLCHHHCALSIGDSPLVIGNISGVSGPMLGHIHIHGQIPILLKPPYF